MNHDRFPLLRGRQLGRGGIPAFHKQIGFLCFPLRPLSPSIENGQVVQGWGEGFSSTVWGRRGVEESQTVSEDKRTERGKFPKFIILSPSPYTPAIFFAVRSPPLELIAAECKLQSGYRRQKRDTWLSCTFFFVEL